MSGRGSGSGSSSGSRSRNRNRNRNKNKNKKKKILIWHFVYILYELNRSPSAKMVSRSICREILEKKHCIFSFISFFTGFIYKIHETLPALFLETFNFIMEKNKEY